MSLIRILKYLKNLLKLNKDRRDTALVIDF